MNDSNTNNLYALVKQVNKFDGKRVGDFLEWQAKLCTALSLNNSLTRYLQRPSRGTAAVE